MQPIPPDLPTPIITPRLANRFGRKPAFYTGIVIATLGSLISIASEPLRKSYPLTRGPMRIFQ